MKTISLKGFVKDVIYTPFLGAEKLKYYDIENFDVNKAGAYGLINLGTCANNLAYSQWKTPNVPERIHFHVYTTHTVSIQKRC